MKTFIQHFKTYILRGLLASIPLLLSYFVVRFFYVFIDKRIVNLISTFIGIRIPGLGIVLVLVVLYVLGYLASNVIGRRVFNLIERISNRIPIIKTTYQVGKQLSSTLSLPEQEVFKRVVLVECFKLGILNICFVTGTILDKKTNEKLLKVFIPTVPNPTSGFLAIVKESQAIDPKWSVEQAMRAVISGGIIGPQEIG